MPTTPGGRGLGLLPDAVDDRDLVFAPVADVEALPAFVDLETDPATPPVWDQGQLGSCTAHGTLACFLFASAKCGADDPMLSRLQFYYDTRVIEGTVAEDAGAQIRDAVKATTGGIAPETLWPYDIDKFAVDPPREVVEAGAANVGLDYRRVGQDSDHIRACLADGFPIDIGVTLYDSFEAQATLASGVLPMPGDGENVIGGHCMSVFGVGEGSYWREHGYPAADPKTLYVKVRNSWGLVYQNGRTGYLLMPMDYLTDPNLGGDYWVIKRTT